MNKKESEVDPVLSATRTRLYAYVLSKVGDPEAAEDIVQDSLLKAFKAGDELRDPERLIPWLHRIIQNTIIDYYRRQNRRDRFVERYRLETDDVVEPDEHAVLCTCVNELVPTLKDEYREVIQELDMREADPDVYAGSKGLSRNNLKVRRHRARQQLKERLQQTCRTCAEHGCLDCTCKSRNETVD